MQLIIRKKNKYNEITSETSVTITDFDHYVKFLELNGIFITESDALYDFTREATHYILPLEV